MSPPCFNAHCRLAPSAFMHRTADRSTRPGALYVSWHRLPGTRTSVYSAPLAWPSQAQFHSKKSSHIKRKVKCRVLLVAPVLHFHVDTTRPSCYTLACVQELESEERASRDAILMLHAYLTFQGHAIFMLHAYLNFKSLRATTRFKARNASTTVNMTAACSMLVTILLPTPAHSDLPSSHACGVSNFGAPIDVYVVSVGAREGRGDGGREKELPPAFGTVEGDLPLTHSLTHRSLSLPPSLTSTYDSK